MKITDVLTSVNDNPKYLKFIPSFINSWCKFYPTIKPTIVYIGDKDLSFFGEFQKFIIPFKCDKKINPVFASQTVRMLYSALMPPESTVMISDIDMVAANSQYFTKTIEDIVPTKLVSFRQPIEHNMIAMCYVAAPSTVWKEMFSIENNDDINEFMLRYSNIQFDGLHGGKGWHTDQEILYTYISRYSDISNNVIFLSDTQTKFNRLDWFHHYYVKEDFLKLLNTGMYTDSHFYADMCKWTSDDLVEISKYFK